MRRDPDREPTHRWSRLLVALLAIACIAPLGRSDEMTSSPRPAVSTGSTGTASPALKPTDAGASTPAVASTPSASPAISLSPTPTDPTRATAPPDEEPEIRLPPDALIRLDGDDYPGRIGSFTFGDLSSSSPWLPGAALDPIEIGQAQLLRVELTDGLSAGSWSAMLARSDDSTGTSARSLTLEPSSSPARLEVRAPRAGEWVLMVTAVFADGLGDANYYWRLVVTR